MKTTILILSLIIIPFLFFVAQGSAPHLFEEHIKVCKEKYELDPNLVHAVIQTESNYNPKAISKSGAMGLMQLMPGTAKELGVNDPFDPKQNIEGGCLYLKKMIDKYHSIVLAVAAYNAGPNAVRNWRRIPPYAETKKYVRKVIRAFERRKRKPWFSKSVKNSNSNSLQNPN